MQVSSYTFQNPYPLAVQVGRPSPEMLQAQQKEVQGELDKQLQDETQVNPDNRKKEVGEIRVKSSTEYQKESTYNETQKSVKAYMNFAKEVQRPEQIKAYVNNTPKENGMNDILPLSSNV